eukprot:TRINITY_DN35812_c0_g1_i2.p1 TRINITY_DN35812_c0_g1~~TRINITY_DN35812_c0_g1_i2.p1  ORF type:complete len:323 (+),score=36.87 TRINITY_DN35812_c0_g1_i2:84-1052(+)
MASMSVRSSDSESPSSRGGDRKFRRGTKRLAFLVIGGLVLVLHKWVIHPPVYRMPAHPLPEARGLADLVESHSALSGLMVVFISYLICSMQRYARHRCPSERIPLEERTDFGRVLFVNAWLALISGCVNAFAFLENGLTVSHHTGNTMRMGVEFGDAALGYAMTFTRVVASFFAGAAMLGASFVDPEANIERRFCPALLSTAFVLLGAFFIKYMHGETMVTTELLAFSQGIMNATTRKFSSMPLSCSHVTGYVTDAGFILGSWGGGVHGAAKPCLKQPIIFLVSIFTFALGGFTTACLDQRFGICTLLVPILGTTLSAFGFC